MAIDRAAGGGHFGDHLRLGRRRLVARFTGAGLDLVRPQCPFGVKGAVAYWYPRDQADDLHSRHDGPEAHVHGATLPDPILSAMRPVPFAET